MPRRRTVRGKGAEPESIFPVDLTPLIDVVFLLLIFFMVSSRIFEPFGWEVELPEADEAPVAQAPAAVPILTVLSGGEILYDGRRFERVAGLPEEIRGAETVILRADRRTSHGDVMTWMDALRGVGVGRVTLSTVPRRDEE